MVVRIGRRNQVWHRRRKMNHRRLRNSKLSPAVHPHINSEPFAQLPSLPRAPDSSIPVGTQQHHVQNVEQSRRSNILIPKHVPISTQHHPRSFPTPPSPHTHPPTPASNI